MRSGQSRRLALCDILQKSHELHPSTTTAQWVDDLAQRTQAPPSTVEALQLVLDLQEDKMAVASKSVVIATTPNVAKQVVSSFARHDIHIQEASQARDLGLDVSSARKPMRRTMAKRWTKAGRRTRRCARFGKTSEQASVHACGEREPGRRKPMVQRPWVRRHRGSSKRGRGL